jgi:transcriptional regulator with XRE-family HTH domain
MNAQSDNNGIATRIKAARTSLGMTQTKFAKLLGVTQGLVSRWERGLIEPRQDIIARLAEIASVSAGEFHYGKATKSGNAASSKADMTGVAGKRLTDAIREAIRRAKAGRDREVAAALTIILDKCEADRERFLAAQRKESGE